MYQFIKAKPNLICRILNFSIINVLHLLKQPSCSKLKTNIFTGLNLNLDFPTDRGHFPETLTSSSLKKQIILYGPCKPSENFLLCSNSMFTDGKSNPRRFSSDFYYSLTKMDSKIPRMWLCYSGVLQKAYCETCWLFADRRGIMFKTNWINGKDDWQHLTQKIIKHEVSKQHIEAMKLRLLWAKNNNTIDKKLEQQTFAEAQCWRDVLKRLIQIVIRLSEEMKVKSIIIQKVTFYVQ